MLKRLLCLFMALCMLAAVGCGSNDGEVSKESSDADIESSEDTSGDISDGNEEEQPPAISGSTEHTEAIDKLLCGGSDRSINSKNLLLSKNYTTEIPADSAYPDSTKILTDGVSPEIFASDGTWAGYILPVKGAVTTIDFDLGGVNGGLLDFSLRALEREEYAIFAPEKVDVYVAGADKTYTRIGTALRPDGDLGSNRYYDYDILLPNAAEARYIRFEITAYKKGWCFIGETSAVSYDEKYDSSTINGMSLNEYYGFEGIPVIESPAYWKDSESDYNKSQNLAKKKPIYLSASEVVSSEIMTEWYNTKKIALLNDGMKSPAANLYNPTWFHMTHGGLRSITIDLEKTSAVDGFSINFLASDGASVLMPTDFTVRLSENGVDWQTVHKQKTITSIEPEAIVTLEESFDKSYKARYVQFSFKVTTHVFLDEISVNGTKNASQAEDLVIEKEPDSTDIANGFLKPEDFCDVHNMALSYHCLTDGNNVPTEDGLITAEEYLPYVAYLDEEGNIKDTFFDAFLYLPYVRHIHGESSIFGRSADGWRTYVDDMFYEDRNMDALDECAERVYGELGITDEKIKVFTSILYTFTTLYDGSKNSFGDIDGDGKNEDFANIEDRKKAIKWIMDEELERFRDRHYKNLEFCGYYWFEESITFSDPHELELIRFASDYAHELGYKLFWIPYRTASGVEDWADLGFDAASLQPNYMFSNTISSDILYSTAERASGLGMCVELEINDPQNLREATKFIEYLIAGALTGYMKSVKMYYQVGIPGAFHTACYSKKPEVRNVYDQTYLFAKELFDPILPEEVVISETPLEFTYTPNEELHGSVDISAFENVTGKLRVAISPKYGCVRINADGSFTYFPAENYSGNDSFAITFDLGYGEPISTIINLKAE